MGRSALGKGYQQVDEENQTHFHFLPCSKVDGPETSHIAEEKMTASGKRERHCHAILAAMQRLKATEKRPVTGARIAKEAGLLIVQVMRRLATDLESNSLIDRAPKMFCEITHAQRIGWFVK